MLRSAGNNIFGEDIVKTLTETVDIKERSKFILMDKIQPPVSKNYIVRAELPQPVLADVISEIGFYGILIRLVRHICLPANEKDSSKLIPRVSPLPVFWSEKGETLGTRVGFEPTN